MKILFVHTNIHRFNPEDYGFSGLIGWPDMQFGISYISSYLKKAGHETKLLFINRHPWEHCASDGIEKFKPDILCFNGVSTQFKYVLKIAKFCKEKSPNIFQVYGGIHATLAKLDLMCLPFDAICKGESEEAMCELVESLKNAVTPQKTMNLTMKKDGKIFSNPIRPFFENLDKLPFPDRKMWEKYIDSAKAGKHVILVSRGCPFECTYCSNKALKRISSGQYVRFRSPDNIIEEVEVVKKEYPELKDVFFESETITANLQWFEKFCTKLNNFNKKQKQAVAFGANIRILPGSDYSRIFDTMKRAGFGYIAVGIESGSEKIRREILSRNYSNQDMIDFFQKAKEKDLKVHAYNMIGLPEETPEDFKETIRLNRICQPEDPHLCIFFPYPGSDLYDLCDKKRYLRKNIDSLEEREDAALKMPFFPPKTIEKYYARFELDVYKGKKNIILLWRRYLYNRYIKKRKAYLFVYLFFTKLLKSLTKTLQKVFKGKNKKIKKQRNKDSDIPDTTYTLW